MGPKGVVWTTKLQGALGFEVMRVLFVAARAYIAALPLCSFLFGNVDVFKLRGSPTFWWRWGASGR